VARRHTLLFSFAHPDDESFSGVGTAMACAAAGARTILLTATRGDKGKSGDPAVCEPQELAAWRERELREAARVAGLDEVHLLDYRDRELAEAPADEIRRSLVTVIRRVTPAVVITFDPNGFNLHPDHVAISRFTSDAIAAASDPRWFPDAGRPHQVQRLLWTPLFPPWEAAAFDDVGAKASADFVIDISRWRDRKAAALRAHRSQHLSVDRYFFSQPNLDRILAIETWRQAWGPMPGARPARDVFEGLS
jgi:LmbE family N-acetylglucosaminyl deacetylase